MDFSHFWKHHYADAIKDEARDQGKYLDMAEETNDPESRRVLQDIAGDEGRHHDLLEGIETTKASPEMDIEQLDFIENDLIARMAHAANFQEWWSLRQQRNQLIAERDMLRTKSRVTKSEKLSDSEITEARGLIAYYNKHRYTATQTIKALQRKFGKLSEEYKAARVYWTETKKDDVTATAELGKEIGFTKYKTVLSPSACPLCRKKSDNGNKIFSQKEIEKTAHGDFVPWHENCYCIVIPWVE
jgi:rubrerythrin